MPTPTFDKPYLQDQEGRLSSSSGNSESLKRKPETTEESAGFSKREERLAYDQAKTEVRAVIMGYVHDFADAHDTYLKEVSRANNLLAHGDVNGEIAKIANEIKNEAESKYANEKAEFLNSYRRIREINDVSFAKKRAAEIIANKQAGEIAARREAIHSILDIIKSSNELLNDPDFQEEVSLAEGYLIDPSHWDNKAELAENESLDDWHNETAAMAKEKLEERAQAAKYAAIGETFRRELELGMNEEKANKIRKTTSAISKSLQQIQQEENEAAEKIRQSMDDDETPIMVRPNPYADKMKSAGKRMRPNPKTNGDQAANE